MPDLPAPFEGFAADLAFRSSSPDTAAVEIPDEGLPDDPSGRRLLVYLGMFDLLAEELVGSCASPEVAAEGLFEVLKHCQALEGPLKFALHDEGGGAGEKELISRMRSREIAATKAWMLPKLRDEIDLYRRRVEALRAALAADRGPEAAP